MKVAIVFEPDAELTDENDPEHEPLRLGEFIDTRDDCLIIWRRADDKDRAMQVLGQGIFENVDPNYVAGAIEVLTDLPE